MAARLLNSKKCVLDTLKSFKQKPFLVTLPLKNFNAGQQIRQMGEHRTISVTPSKFEWTKFKDTFHFHLLLNLIPMFAFITYINLTRGRAELQEIPEDYEPQYWEYYKHPITQLISRYFLRNPVQEYEMHLHNINRHNEMRFLRSYERRTRLLMQQRGDAKGWYFKPVYENNYYKSFEEHETRAEKGFTKRSG